MMAQQHAARGSTLSLANRCRAGFERKDWYRGIQYFQAGAVKIVGECPDGVAAEVRGSNGNFYTVQVAWGQGRKLDRLDVSCQCPRCDDGYFCKHIAATIQ